MSDLKPCPFCGGEAAVTPSAVCREMLHVHCKDHTCPGWSVSRCQPAWWNYRATPTLSAAMEVLLNLDDATFDAARQQAKISHKGAVAFLKALTPSRRPSHDHK